MDIPEFDMRVLADIVDSENGWHREELYQKYGPEISGTIDLLTGNGLVKVHEHDLKPFMPPGSDYTDPPKGAIVATRAGKIEVRRWRTLHILSSHERWKERIFGFLSGVAVTVFGGLILEWILK